MCVSINGPGDLEYFDLLTLKLERKSHLKCGTFLPNLGSRIIRMNATDGQMQRLLPLSYKGGT